MNSWACNFANHLNTNVWPVLRLLGPGLSQSPRAFSKLCRLGRSLLQHRPECQDDWIHLVSELLLPALSLIPANPGVSNELWALLKIFPYYIRYSLYADWKDRTYYKHAALIHIRTYTIQEARKIMR